ncbi:MAG TPA: DUF1489 domain-containing protein [Hyphomicrobiaceae bacterium]|nr:DUF1489 domain-containing protein [Hyphomicrobiaceae bacterium]
MTLHLVKLCVGCDSIEDLAAWQRQRLRDMRKNGGSGRLYHRTYQTPKRSEELLDGGSLYWVIKGFIQARQAITGFDEGTKDDGRPCCLILLSPRLVPVRPTPRRAFQGWRYLEPADAPPDLTGCAAAAFADLPPKMRRDLIELGLL